MLPVTRCGYVLQHSLAKSDRKRSSVQKSPSARLDVMSVLRVRRPVLQGDDDDDDASQQASTHQQLLTSHSTTVSSERGELTAIEKVS